MANGDVVFHVEDIKLTNLGVSGNFYNSLISNSATFLTSDESDKGNPWYQVLVSGTLPEIDLGSLEVDSYYNLSLIESDGTTPPVSGAIVELEGWTPLEKREVQGAAFEYGNYEVSLYHVENPAYPIIISGEYGEGGEITSILLSDLTYKIVVEAA